MFCKHYYEYSQGYFTCKKCGKSTYARNYRRKKSRKIALGIISAIIVCAIVFLFANNILVLNQEKIQQTIQKDTREIQKTFNKNLEKNPIQHIEKPLKKITDIPKQIQNAKPINPKPTINTLELENKIHVLINQQRTNNGLSSLTLDSKISDIARIHSKDMATRGFFDHENPEGMDPTDRGIEYGFRCEKVVGNLIYSGIGENIFQNNLYDRVWYTNGIPTSYEWNDMDELAQSTVNGWMESTGHRKNILTQIYDKEGIGVIVSSDDKVFITQDFC